ncbi:MULTISPECIES: phosphoserine phosphatase SerB [Herbaspirillum]|uniref:Phosphoserine phosphatase n=1 Tax=Herbaspirillum huttiense subsp. lycopersici TaxID=3074428 RepID=A0ABU2EJ33_9BURK|nr:MULTISPECIES: phosphoserine phosphatase SerB [Herbaspirillum]MBP1314083.1 phosphoserine phosphatase [Herbaspirillum sp. 1130]MDR9848161.1 phosphoserine phosphatase SerB [Herbaspirillum huttiense SE1]
MNQQNNMNLILQAPKQHAVPSSAIESIAALAGGRAERIADDRVPDADAWRVAGVSQSDALKASIDAACLQARLDYAFIDEGRKLSDFRLVAMDMDSTLITIECIDEIADMQGLKPQVAEITEAAMRGEIEFNESLTRRVALLKGLDAGALQRVYDERLQLSLGAENMLKAVQAAGLKTLLVSGGFTFFTDRMKARLKLDYTHANTLEVADGKLTGNVVGGIVNADEKRATVERICREIGAEPSQAIVMGDGANDLRMMGISGLSVAFRAKPVVRAQASVGLNFVGLDGILNLLA